MYYEINVALKVNGKYQHYFATAERSIDNAEKAVHIANELQEMYDEKFGIDNVRVTITKWQKIGKEIKAR